MKRIWIAAIFLIAVAALCTYDQLVIKDTFEAISFSAEQAQNAIDNNDLESAAKHCVSISNEWNKRYKMLAIIIEHGSLNDLSVCISGLLHSVDEKDKEAMSESLKECKTMAQMIYENQLPRLENIF